MDKLVALAGNPNVGKTSVFNALTGMKQHTGNWTGKTVANAKGRFNYKGNEYTLMDIPGTYSLLARSAEEEIACDFICFKNPDAVIAVCDAMCLERNLNLVLQTTELTGNVVICVNLMDEAVKRGVLVNCDELEKKLGIPVAPTCARDKRGLDGLLEKLDATCGKQTPAKRLVTYPPEIEKAVSLICESFKTIDLKGVSERWLALRLLCQNDSLVKSASEYIGADIEEETKGAMERAKHILAQSGVSFGKVEDIVTKTLSDRAAELAKHAVKGNKSGYSEKDRRLDKILTGRLTGFPIMLLLLAGVLWFTMVGANYPSNVLSNILFSFEGVFRDFLLDAGANGYVTAMLTEGMYRVAAWVVAVMLPPMAVFFPLFTILEDLGYLPRMAFNLDRAFKKCGACGKQALTMCQGLGCNAVGVTGCRIIASPRERLIAILTNCFVPCNGRFPMIITLITIFFAGSFFCQAAMLTAVIAFGMIMTLVASYLLSKTVLKGEVSAFALELPPFRMPKIGDVIVRSVFDRTLFVLGRAIAVAAPAGIVIWLMANVNVSGESLLALCADALEPIGKIMGLDGFILTGFLLGFPANEIVIPIIITAYTASGSLTQASGLSEISAVFAQNGWDMRTAVCALIFSLMRFPCSTTLLTIKKETKSLKWTAVSVILPLAFGFTLCAAFNALYEIFYKIIFLYCKI